MSWAAYGADRITVTVASTFSHKHFIKLMKFSGAIKKLGTGEVSGRSLHDKFNNSTPID